MCGVQVHVDGVLLALEQFVVEFPGMVQRTFVKNVHITSAHITSTPKRDTTG